MRRAGIVNLYMILSF